MKLLKDNCLSIVLILLFLFSLAGQFLTGWYEHNEDQLEHGRPEIAITEYATDGHFLEALFENWESEFLQMGVFIILTVFLFQKGSAESKDPEKKGTCRRNHAEFEEQFENAVARSSRRVGAFAL